MGLVRSVLFGVFAAVLLADCTTLFGVAPDPKRNGGKTLYTPSLAQLVGLLVRVLFFTCAQHDSPWANCMGCRRLTADMDLDLAYCLLSALSAFQPMDIADIWALILRVVGGACNVVLDGSGPSPALSCLHWRSGARASTRLADQPGCEVVH